MDGVTGGPTETGRADSQAAQPPQRTPVDPPWGSLRCRGVPLARLSTPAPDTPGDASRTLEDLKQLGSGAIPKAVPLSMTQKRLLRELREADTTVPDGNWTLWEVTHRKSLRNLHREFRNALGYMEIWRHSLRKIEGRFGTGICSYFSVHRFLVVLNLFTFLLLSALVVIPLTLDGRGSDVRPTAAPETPSPRGNCTRYDHSNPGLVSFYEVILDVLSGTGHMEFSLLFYGFYPERGLDLWGVGYQLPLAYVLTVVATFLASFTCIVHRAVLGYKQSFLLSDGALSNYSRRVFCGWDFCLSQPGAVAFRHTHLRGQLKMALEEDMSRRRRSERTRSETALLVTRRVMVNALTLLVIGGAFYAIYRATEFSQSSRLEEGLRGLLTEYLPSIVITAANFVTPPLFQYLVTLERYTAATEIKLTLLRCVFLKLASLGVLLYSLWNQITCHGRPDSDPRCQPCGYNYQQYQCWETKIGQEMYKLTIFDFLIALAVILFVDFPRKLLVEFSSLKVARLWGQQEFLVPQHMLDLVYGQTLCWTGTLYSPLLPLLHTLKLIALFHLKKLTLFRNCRAGGRAVQSAASVAFFLLVLALGFLLSLTPLLYTLTSIAPSRACGPFRRHPSLWDVVPGAVARLPDVPRRFLQFTSSLAFLVPVCAMSSVLLLFLVVRAGGYKHTIGQLKLRLRQEGQDRRFLLQKLAALNLPPS